LKFSDQNFVCIFSSLPCMLHSSAIYFSLIISPKCYFMKSTNYKVPHNVIFSSQPFLPVYMLRPNILLSTLFSNTLSLFFSLRVKNPYKIPGKIIVVYILIFTSY
jgi:hypothetical protein